MWGDEEGGPSVCGDEEGGPCICGGMRKGVPVSVGG